MTSWLGEIEAYSRHKGDFGFAYVTGSSLYIVATSTPTLG